MTRYVPELGQAAFGQPYKQYKCSNLLTAALHEIESELCRVQENINQYDYPSPFENTGNRFKCGVFEVEAYLWNEDIPQPYNFKWRDLEVSWYKYLGRGMSVNRIVKPNEISEMLDECMDCLLKIEAEHFEKV